MSLLEANIPLYRPEVSDDPGLRPKKIRKRRHPRLLALSQLPRWIRNCVEIFLSRNPEYALPSAAKDECTWASEHFLKLLCLEYPDYMKAERWGVQEVTHDWAYSRYCRMGIEHDVARVGNYLFDFTARQFHPRIAFPRIWRQRWFPDTLRDPQIVGETSIAFYEEKGD